MPKLTDDTAGLSCIADWVRWAASRFAEAGLSYGHGTDNALDEAYHLVLHALHLPTDLPAVYLQTHLTASEQSAVLALLRRRLETRVPAAYLIGEIMFAGLPFSVDARVLVPRSPFAELIERGFGPWVQDEPTSILDLCTGSGCIGIACAVAFDQAQVDLADLSAEALVVAQRNVERHHLTARVALHQGDLWAAVGDRRYDLIVSNPPYVPTAEWTALAEEYRREPRMALEAGADGMALVARILADAAAHLSEGGWLFCEVGGSVEEFEARWPRLPVTWVDFSRGGDGVFVISRHDLVADAAMVSSQSSP
ncbi:50S ribosomal protein L3 N(5)-glutamine methyltransferase [Flagellatimonas centrodinii]|uniref:50S ribosomal protein L3 N(5)-glutamine methyltransferase n=1 Tax=Flagellatimonas centrodinii TaxID=2806210 RepID=UPI001FEEE899|nr:50S ribosomal protein L3 N(5)-glutamine methyltransferase [Flagellatimonas centrodinii]ULQ46434.1 50S ribosomal protein L3 N(5)-glutamine methyltransferase [Flagellatimonas centrodinii]